MLDPKLKQNRNYGYHILINTFEPFLRYFIANDIFVPIYGEKWRSFVPEGVFEYLAAKSIEPLDSSELDQLEIEEFFEEISFLNLKDIILFSSNFKNAKGLIGNISKNKFTEIMDILNEYRRKIAHAKSTFSRLDLLNLIDQIYFISQGDKGNQIRNYLDNKEYTISQDIDVPSDFYEEIECLNNLPTETYDIDGGFVGRSNEIKIIQNLLKSDQDRIITITGAGGVGKTAIALRVAYGFLRNPYNTYDAILWFSAKSNYLTDDGIVALEPGITDSQQLVRDILGLIDPVSLETFQSSSVPFESYKNRIYNLFNKLKYLIIIDNLETILGDDDLISFIKDVPRPSQVLITSRKGLGEIERRFALGDLSKNDAIRLFRLIARERGLDDIIKLGDDTITDLVESVRCYPLLIKWSLGQVCLGQDINKAFSAITSGDSEIAIFSFNDVFLLLHDKSKLVLFSMIVAGEKSVSKHVLTHLANLTDEEFEDVIKELIITSFIFPIITTEDRRIITEYSMLELTRGYVESKLDEEQTILQMLMTRYYHLAEQIELVEKSKSSFAHSLISLGIKTLDDQIAYNYVKTAKNYETKNDYGSTEKNYERALEISPNLVYSYTEYAKFKYRRNHHKRALDLAKRGVEIDSKNYHALVTYAYLLRRTGNYDEAIRCLLLAKELNPNYLPIYMELGRAYMFKGEYEKAESEIQKALKEEKYPHFRHKVISLSNLANNYRRWSDEFKLRRDYNGQLEKLEQAREAIEEAMKIDMKDRIMWQEYRRIYLTLGIAICQNKGFSEGKKLIEIAILPENFQQYLELKPSKSIAADGYLFLAIYAKKDGSISEEEIREYIKEGLSNCKKDTKIHNRLISLRNELDGIEGNEVKQSRRMNGLIEFYNENRFFGVIIEEKTDEKYIFFRNDIKEDTILSDESLSNKKVSFLLKVNRNPPPGKPSLKADDIYYLDEDLE